MQAASQAPAVADTTTITLSGTVTPADKGTYQERPFDVPAGVTRIDVDFAYDNRGKGTELEVGLFDSQSGKWWKRDAQAITAFTNPVYARGF